MDAEAKKQYDEKAATDKARYKDEMSDYKTKEKDAAAAAAKAASSASGSSDDSDSD